MTKSEVRIRALEDTDIGDITAVYNKIWLQFMDLGNDTVGDLFCVAIHTVVKPVAAGLRSRFWTGSGYDEMGIGHDNERVGHS